MTPELEKEIIVGGLSVFFAALFAGVPSGLLVWWTWKRDQEQLIVQKLVNRLDSITGGKVLERDELGPTFGILIRNRSLFSVHVSGVGFQIDGQVIPLEHPSVPMKMKRNPDPHSPYTHIGDEGSDPWEIPSQASQQVHVTASDRPKVAAALLAASNKLNISMEELLMSENVVALVVTETGKEFSSVPFSKRLKHMFERALLAPQ